MATAPYGGQRGRDSDFRVREDGQVEVRDLDFAAYLHMSGVPVVDIVRLRSETLDVRITFGGDEPGPRTEQLALQWLNSESARFASAVRALKKACRAAPGPGPNRG